MDGEQKPKEYVEEQAFRTLVVARELKRRVGMGKATGILCGAAKVLAAEDLGEAEGQRFIEQAVKNPGTNWFGKGAATA